MLGQLSVFREGVCVCVCVGVIFPLFALFYWQARLAWAPPAALFQLLLPSFGAVAELLGAGQFVF